MKVIPGYLISAILTFILSSCSSYTPIAEESIVVLTQKLSYEEQPQVDKLKNLTVAFLKNTLKDPDSLKNLQISNILKCYAAATPKVADSLAGIYPDDRTPKYTYGYWCYTAAYNASNSYGGITKGTDIFRYHKGGIQSGKKYLNLGNWQPYNFATTDKMDVYKQGYELVRQSNNILQGQFFPEN